MQREIVQKLEPEVHIENDGTLKLGKPKQPELTYKPCPCKEKHFLSRNSLLYQYLSTKCKGWTEDPSGTYTIEKGDELPIILS